ncbi:MAG: hypothetical protein KKH85_03085, partial [Proteobacteria bacterium]|nr:hypothetical protein [Pseudomonadota bacterium]
MLHIVNPEGRSGKKLIKKPQTPCVLAYRFGPDITQKIFRCDCLKQVGKYREIHAVILECEFEMITQCVPRPVLRRIDLLDNVSGRVDSVDSTGCDKGPVPVRDGVQAILINQSRISCDPDRFQSWYSP